MLLERERRLEKTVSRLFVVGPPVGAKIAVRFVGGNG